MNLTRLSFFLLVTTSAAVGCAPTEGRSAPPLVPPTTSYSRPAVPQPDLALVEPDDTYARKTELVANMKKDLTAIEDELTWIAAKLERSRGAAKVDAKAKLELVREKWAQAKKQLDQAERATESTWSDVKIGFKQSYGELKDSIDGMRQSLSDTIAP